jgi:hypothetical protein
LSQSLEDSGQLQGEMILEQNTDDYITNLKKGNANILVSIFNFLLFMKKLTESENRLASDADH